MSRIRHVLPVSLAFLALVVFFQAGRQMALWSGALVPPVIGGLLLLFLVLVVTGKTPPPLQRVAGFLIVHMNLLFIPAGVGLMAFAGLLARDLWPILVALLVSTLLGMAVTAWVFLRLVRPHTVRDREGEPGE